MIAAVISFCAWAALTLTLGGVACHFAYRRGLRVGHDQGVAAGRRLSQTPPGDHS